MEVLAKNQTGWIYVIRNKVNDKVYVGQTRKAVEERFREHVSCATSGHASRIQWAMRIHGIDNFYAEALEEVDVADLDEREKYWVHKLNSFEDGYNSTPDGQGFARNDYRNKAKLSKYQMGQLHLKNANKKIEQLEAYCSAKDKDANHYLDLLLQSCETTAETGKRYKELSEHCSKLEIALMKKVADFSVREFIKCKIAAKRARV